MITNTTFKTLCVVLTVALLFGYYSYSSNEKLPKSTVAPEKLVPSTTVVVPKAVKSSGLVKNPDATKGELPKDIQPTTASKQTVSTGIVYQEAFGANQISLDSIQGKVLVVYVAST